MVMPVALSVLLLLEIWGVQGGVIHVDVEPHSTKDPNGRKPWNSNISERNRISTEWLEMLRIMKSRLDLTTHTLTVDVAMQYSMPASGMAGGIVVDAMTGKSQPLLRHCLEIVDNVVLMDYRNFFDENNCEFVGGAYPGASCPKSDSIRSHAEEALDIVKTFPGKRFSVGVETAPVSKSAGIPNKLTFASLPSKEVALEAALTQVVETLGPEYPTVPIGLVVHDFGYYKALAKFSDINAVNRQLHGGQRYCRSMWLWDTDYLHPNKGGRGKTQQNVLDFAKSHGVSTIILNALKYNVNKDLAPTTKAFILKAWAQDIDVELMLAEIGHGFARKEKHGEVIVQLDKAIRMWNELDNHRPALLHKHCKKIQGYGPSPPPVMPPPPLVTPTPTPPVPITPTPAPKNCVDVSATNPQGRCWELMNYVKFQGFQHYGAAYKAYGLTPQSSMGMIQRYLHDKEFDKWKCPAPCSVQLLMSASSSADEWSEASEWDELD